MVNPVSGSNNFQLPPGNQQVSLQNTLQNVQNFIKTVTTNPELSDFGAKYNKNPSKNEEKLLQKTQAQQLNLAINFLNQNPLNMGLEPVSQLVTLGDATSQEATTAISSAYHQLTGAISAEGTVSQGALNSIGLESVTTGVSNFQQFQPTRAARTFHMAGAEQDSVNNLAATQIGLGAVVLGDKPLLNHVESYFADPTQGNMNTVIDLANKVKYPGQT